ATEATKKGKDACLTDDVSSITTELKFDSNKASTPPPQKLTPPQTPSFPTTLDSIEKSHYQISAGAQDQAPEETNLNVTAANSITPA
ncbi:MAG: hypothetical protein MHPSP_001289, partial [Paramarteilia canceri]